jgi:hypothetical protein
MASESTELERRVARCEAMMAAMMITTFPGADRDDWYLLRDLMKRRIKEPFDDEWLYLFDRIISRREKFGDSDLRQRLSQFEESFASASSRLAELSEVVEVLRKEAPQRELFQQHVSRIDSISQALPDEQKRLARSIESLTLGQRTLQTDVHTYLVAQSMGLDLNVIPLPRFVPIRVYLSEASRSDIQNVSNAVSRIAEAFGFAVSDEFPEKTGSWWKKWFVKTKEVATQPEVQQRLEELERVFKLKGLGKPQAEIDKTQAEAVALLVKAVEGIPNVAIQTGAILLVKTPRNGDNCLQVRTLTQRELIHLEKHQDLLTTPDTVFSQLAGIARNAEQSGEPEPPITPILNS